MRGIRTTNKSRRKKNRNVASFNKNVGKTI
jgi:hypothetical protein